MPLATGTGSVCTVRIRKSASDQHFFLPQSPPPARLDPNPVPDPDLNRDPVSDPEVPPPAGQAGDFFHANTILWDLHDANGASVYVALRHVGTLLKIRRATALAGALDTLLRLTGSHGPI